MPVSQARSPTRLRQGYGGASPLFTSYLPEFVLYEFGEGDRERSEGVVGFLASLPTHTHPLCSPVTVFQVRFPTTPSLRSRSPSRTSGEDQEICVPPRLSGRGTAPFLGRGGGGSSFLNSLSHQQNHILANLASLRLPVLVSEARHPTTNAQGRVGPPPRIAVRHKTILFLTAMRGGGPRAKRRGGGVPCLLSSATQPPHPTTDIPRG